VIDARAASAYFVCRSVRRLVPLERLSIAELNAMLAARNLVMLPASDEEVALRAVGGFEAFELVAALSLLGHGSALRSSSNHSKA
jgi:hypothetical protein